MLSPYTDEQGRRAVATGPHVSVSAETVASFALLLHEFATNAAKYGALSSPNGTVRVDWLVEDGRLRLTWREMGGPPLKGPPETEGFGTMLTSKTVERQLAGELSHDWLPDGLVIRLDIPLERLSD